jgi:WD40 repeat protein
MPFSLRRPPDQPDRLISTITGHRGVIRAVAIAPDGTWLATGSNDQTAQIWDTDGTPRATLTGHKYLVRSVAIAPDGTWLATADAKAVRIWDTDGTPRATLTGHSRLAPPPNDLQ